MSQREDAEQAADAAIPQAIIRTPAQSAARHLKTRLWWLTGLCVLLAVGLVVSSLRGQGRPITIHFEDGYGLKVGDTLRYRGIDVGTVTSVALADDLSGVDVQVTLAVGSERVAVEGSQFWIQRARLRLGQVAGLDTVLGAKYLVVIPGDPAGKLQGQFTGLETPLVSTSGDYQDVRIEFPAGEGLEVGDPVRYRGITVGEVTFVELGDGLESVEVVVRLVGASRQFARAGTQFWIERPRLDLTEVRGLETLIGGRYITLQPMSQASPLQTQFVGLAEPPPMARRDGTLEIELDAPRRLGIVRGAPITYRGLEVGRVANVGLAKDGVSVKIVGVVDTEYTELIRANSKWWAIGGIEVDAGLRGLNVSVESLSAWIRGGIAFATPLQPGERVVTGHRFMLEPKPQPEWLEWQPRIAIGSFGRSATGLQQPMPVRVVASWKASWLGLYRRHTAECWGLALDDSTLRVPVSLLKTAAETGTQVTFEIAGQSIPFEPQQLSQAGQIGRIPIPSDVSLELWPAANIAPRWTGKTTLLVVNPELSEPLAIDHTRVSVTATGDLKLAPGVPIAAPLEGSTVIDSTTSQVVGLLVMSDGVWQIALLR